MRHWRNGSRPSAPRRPILSLRQSRTTEMAGSPFPLPPGSTIGIIGGGQLGRMLALAAARLGFSCVVLTPDAKDCAAQVAARTLTAAYDDEDALAVLAGLADVVTFEFENVPVKVIDTL